MRFFKHGESLAIVLPDKHRKSSSVSESEEFEFFELSKGVFVLVEKRQLEEMVRKNVFAELLARVPNDPSGSPSSVNLRAEPAASSGSSASRTAEFMPAAASKPGVGSASAAPSRSASPAVSNGSPEALLESKGFAVIANESEARLLSISLEQKIKSKRVFGVRGFDKKFYIVSEAYLTPLAGRIQAVLARKELPLKEIALQLKAEEDGCLAVLQVLKEQGEVIEKRRGVFKAI